MAFSKIVLIVFAVLVISVEVSAHRGLAKTKIAPTTHGRGGFNSGVIGGDTGNGGKRPCNLRKTQCMPEKCNNPYSWECHRYGKGGNGEKGGRGAPGPETKN